MLLQSLLRPVLTPLMRGVFDNSINAIDPTKVRTPVFSPSAGEYGPTTAVSITSPTAGATIRYTTDGSTPTNAVGTVYSAPVSIAATTTLKAIAYDGVLIDSDVKSGTFTINGAAATPTFDPAAGSYTSTQSVTIASATTGASIYYTTDGSTPDATDTLYTVPIGVDITATIKAIAIKTGWSDSAVGSAAYTISTGAPSLTADDGSTILYEDDGVTALTED